MGDGRAAAGRAEELSAGRRWTAFAFLMLAEFFYGWSFNTVDFLRPQIRESLGLTLTQAGSAYTAQSIGALVGAVTLAQVADHVGKQRTLFFVIAGYAVFGGLGALVGSYPQLLVQRFALGFFLGAIFPVLIGTYMGLFPSGMRGKLAAVGSGTYNLSVIALGYALALAVDNDWRLLLWIGAVPPLLLAPLVFVFVPNDRTFSAWGASGEVAPPLSRLPVVDLFKPGLRGLTVRLFVLVGCNFFAYQAFAGWVTSYLKDARQLSPAVYGPIAAWQFWGALIGGFFWGWFSDRFGRKRAAAGFFGGAAMVFVYLFAADTPEQLRWAGFTWGFMISASVAWAPWMSELFPVNVRATAMSIFNWGRIISMTAPLITGEIARAYGLTTAMTLSGAGFALAGFVWLMLPETVANRSRRDASG